VNPDSKTVTYEYQYGELPTLTRTGYTFSGWDRAIPETMPAEDITVTARWSINSYTITFDAAGGSAVSAITKNYGASVSAPKAPARTGYTFAGWYLGDEAYIFSTMPAENITLTARWTANADTKYTVKHYLQNADDDEYTLQETETLSGTTGAATAAAAKAKTGDYAHFTARAFDQSTVAADGSTVIGIYYDRDAFTVTLHANGGTLDGAETLRADFSVTLEKETFACMLCFGADGAPVYGEIAQDGKIIAAVEFTDFVFGDILLPDA